MMILGIWSWLGETELSSIRVLANTSKDLFLLVKWLLNGILHIGQFFRFGLALQVSQIICPSLHWNIFFGGHAISRHTGHSSRLYVDLGRILFNEEEAPFSPE